MRGRLTDKTEMEHTNNKTGRAGVRGPGTRPDAFAYRRWHLCHFPTDRRLPPTTGGLRRRHRLATLEDSASVDPGNCSQGATVISRSNRGPVPGTLLARTTSRPPGRFDPQQVRPADQGSRRADERIARVVKPHLSCQILQNFGGVSVFLRLCRRWQIFDVAHENILLPKCADIGRPPYSGHTQAPLAF